MAIYPIIKRSQYVAPLGDYVKAPWYIKAREHQITAFATIGLRGIGYNATLGYIVAGGPTAGSTGGHLFTLNNPWSPSPTKTSISTTHSYAFEKVASSGNVVFLGNRLTDGWTLTYDATNGWVEQDESATLGAVNTQKHTRVNPNFVSMYVGNDKWEVSNLTSYVNKVTIGLAMTVLDGDGGFIGVGNNNRVVVGQASAYKDSFFTSGVTLQQVRLVSTAIGQRAWFCGNDGAVGYTDDWGQSSVAPTLVDVTIPGLTGVILRCIIPGTDPNKCGVIAPDGTLYFTIDAGVTWESAEFRDINNNPLTINGIPQEAMVDSTHYFDFGQKLAFVTSTGYLYSVTAADLIITRQDSIIPYA